nr:LysE family translocator [uncultured Methanoregula sp.]
MISGNLFGTHDFFIFLLSGILLNIVPGQDTLYILGRSLSQGRSAGIVSVLGIGSGCLIHVTAAALGLYAVLTLCPLAFFIITAFGGLYLVWLGISPWLHRHPISAGFVSAPASAPVNLRVVYRQGLLTNLLNPKVALFFIAFLPQFIDPASGYGVLSFLFLGGTFMLTGTIWCLILAVSAAAFADALKKSPGIQLGFDIVASLLFIVLGADLLIFHL